MARGASVLWFQAAPIYYCAGGARFREEEGTTGQASRKTECDSTWKLVYCIDIFLVSILRLAVLEVAIWFSMIASAHLAGACISVHHFCFFTLRESCGLWSADGLIRYSVSARGV